MSKALSKKQRASNLILQARALHTARNLHGAMETYHSVLVLDPKNVEALNLIGTLKAELGNFEEGLRWLDKAIAAAPNVARSHFNRGNILEYLNRYGDALTSYNKALARDPNFAEAYHSRGIALARLGRLQEALESYDAALSLNPSMAQAYFNRGNALQHLGRFDDAVMQYELALQSDSSCAEFYNNKAAALKNLRRFDEARVAFEQALRLNPAYAHAHNNLGLMLQENGQHEQAIAHYDTAIALLPDYAVPYNNKGIILGVQHRFAEALAHYDTALRLNPNYVEAYNNKGFTLQEMCRYEDALACYDKALSLNPHNAGAHFNKGSTLLIQGNFTQGWAEFEWRWKREDVVPVKFSSPAWSGKEPLAGKTILLHAEQGMGDAIQFCRYVPMVQTLGATVLLRVHKPLVPLLAGLASKPQLLALNEDAPQDYHCLLLSLPHVFNTQHDTIPAEKAYLFANEDKCQQWQSILGTKTKPRVGVVWAGNPKHKNNHNRSIALPLFAQLFVDAKGMEFHCLQKEISYVDTQLLQKHAVHSHAEQLQDFTDTAALIMQMDVVITVDTAVAHLAGALGKKVWILIPFAPDFRWMVQRSDSPWYPTAQLFRQSEPANWQSVINQVAEKLKELAYAPHT